MDDAPVAPKKGRKRKWLTVALGILAVALDTAARTDVVPTLLAQAAGALRDAAR